MKNEDLPHEPLMSRSNGGGDISGLTKCGAKTRQGTPCRQVAMRNGRCRFHGGKSTGPKTPDGRARSRRANWKHGRYSAEAKARQRELRELLKDSARVLEALTSPAVSTNAKSTHGI